MTKRKSCPVNKREFLIIEDFDEKDKGSYDGTETVRGLNKFSKPWFSENNIVILMVSKSFQGKTFVVPYIDKDGKRYWISDPLRKERRKKEAQLRAEKIKEQQKEEEKRMIEYIEQHKTTNGSYEFEGIPHSDGTFFVDKETFIKIKKEEPTEFDVAKDFRDNSIIKDLYVISMLDFLGMEQIKPKCKFKINIEVL